MSLLEATRRKDDILRRDAELAQRLLQRQVSGLAIVLLILFPISLLRVGRVGLNPTYVIQWLVAIGFLVLFLFRKRLKPRVLGTVVTLTVFLVILGGISNYGLLAPAQVVVPFIAVLASMQYGRTATIWCYSLSCAAVAAIGAFYISGVLHYRIDTDAYLHSWTSWLVLLSDQMGMGFWYLFLIVPVHEAERKGAERLEAVLQGINDALFIHDKDSGAILQVNQKMCSMYACTPDDAAGLSVADLSAGIPPYAQDDAKAWMDAAVQRGPQLFEWHAKDRKGRLFWVEVNMRLAVLGGKERLLVLVRDISERRHLEEQLRQSQKMEAVGSLAGGVAHDFNNVLGVILNCTEYVADVLGEAHPLRSDLLEIERATQRAASLTRQLLAFSRKQLMQPVPLRLNQIASDMDKMLRRLIGEHIDLALKPDPTAGAVMADPGQIEQVIMNLVVNARDALPRGGKITIETASVELHESLEADSGEVLPGRYVVLAVTDNGCGMDALTRARAFEPFFTTKERGKGTGLGLSLVYGVVKQSGGAILLDSQIGYGSSIRIFLPELSIGAREAISSRLSVAKQTVPNATILLVEDDEPLRAVTRRTLEAVGYSVLVAEDGPAALALCAEYPKEIHLLLTDVIMPKMSGKALAERLAQTRAGMRVLYISGYTDDTIAHHGVLDSGIELLNKPFTAAQLTEKVEEVLRRKSPKEDGLVTTIQRSRHE